MIQIIEIETMPRRPMADLRTPEQVQAWPGVVYRLQRGIIWTGEMSGGRRVVVPWYVWLGELEEVTE